MVSMSSSKLESSSQSASSRTLQMKILLSQFWQYTVASFLCLYYLREWNKARLATCGGSLEMRLTH